ncbi:hypothetical protein FP483_15105 (plasmid) [Staphylococcus aureus]|uniref:Uncharacterized protein n=1 Tax=Staphylococcus aureus TaxID=1280 RepID=A0A517KMQ2_STAAU|nr:hypothetical protein [Staphylococcus aureus]QDS64664.1 hypothetical protein FP483_15105 [Staphylococcus aureus]
MDDELIGSYWGIVGGLEEGQRYVTGSFKPFAVAAVQLGVHLAGARSPIKKTTGSLPDNHAGSENYQ